MNRKKRNNKFNPCNLNLVIFIAALLIIILFSINYLKSNKNQVCIKDNCFLVSLASTQEERQQGLMNVNKLDENKGMLFIFQEEDINPFWMKNTLIPLDIIWINSSLDVVYIKENAQPCNETCEIIIPTTKSLYTLEINANLTEKYPLKLGDKVLLNFP